MEKVKGLCSGHQGPHLIDFELFKRESWINLS